MKIAVDRPEEGSRVPRQTNTLVLFALFLHRSPIGKILSLNYFPLSLIRSLPIKCVSNNVNVNGNILPSATPRVDRLPSPTPCATSSTALNNLENFHRRKWAFGDGFILLLRSHRDSHFLKWMLAHRAFWSYTSHARSRRRLQEKIKNQVSG